MSKSVPPLIFVSPHWDLRLKPFPRLVETTTPAYLFIQTGVYHCHSTQFLNPIEIYTVAFVSDSSPAASRSYVAKANNMPTIIICGNARGEKLSVFT